VFIFFGFVAVGGTYYVQTNTYTLDVFISSIICGSIVDTANGKHTIIEKLGGKFGSDLFLILGVIAYILCVNFAIKGHI